MLKTHNAQANKIENVECLGADPRYCSQWQRPCATQMMSISLLCFVAPVVVILRQEECDIICILTQGEIASPSDQVTVARACINSTFLKALKLLGRVI
jgi:hypothetical protein